MTVTAVRVRQRELPELSRAALLVVGAVVVVLTVASPGYGFHRDELYFLAAAEHLAWGYPDQPPVTPLLAWLGNAIAPGSVWGVRIPATTVSALTVLFVALTAREMGATRRGQFIAALTTAASGHVLILGHLLSTATVDLCFGAAVVWLVAKLVRTRDHRLLVLIGAVVGLGLLNKTLLALLALGLLVGIAVAGPRDVLRGRWLAVGVAVALLLWLPNIVWQARHGWPFFDMLGVLTTKEYMGGRLGFVPFQFVLFSPLLSAVWIAGLVRLSRTPAARPFRAFAVAYAVMAVVLLAAGGTAYYLAAGYPALIAAGAIAVDKWIVGQGRTVLGAVAVVLSAAMYSLLGLPVVPADQIADTPVPAVYGESVEQIGWPEMVDAVHRVYTALPADEQARAVIVTANYGEAGAVRVYGPALGLPPAYSGHNGYADWEAPPDSADVVIVLGGQADSAPPRWTSACREIRTAAVFDNGYQVDNEEQGVAIRVCRGLTRPWSRLWPELRRLS